MSWEIDSSISHGFLKDYFWSVLLNFFYWLWSKVFPFTAVKNVHWHPSILLLAPPIPLLAPPILLLAPPNSTIGTPQFFYWHPQFNYWQPQFFYWHPQFNYWHPPILQLAPLILLTKLQPASLVLWDWQIYATCQLSQLQAHSVVLSPNCTQTVDTNADTKHVLPPLTSVASCIKMHLFQKQDPHFTLSL